MKFIRNSSEQEVVAEILQSEIRSPRWKKKLGGVLSSMNVSEEIILHPDLGDDSQNKLRKEILGEFRGFGRNKELFEDFPKQVEWKQVLLGKNELFKVKYINYSYWNELSGGSRLPADAATNIQQGKVVFNVPNDNFTEAAQSLNQGAQFPTLIFVAKDEQSDMVILEGHLRVTAYMLNPTKVPEAMEVIIGYSPEFSKWGCY